MAYFLSSIDEGRRYDRVQTLSGGFIGVSVWSLPLEPAEASEKAAHKSVALQETLGAEAAAFYSEIACNMSRGTATVTHSSDWYLSIAGVLPGHQGRGLGAQLIRPVLEEADREGVASYLETFSARNMPFYERLGYVPQRAFPEPVTGATYWVMRRAPGGAPEREVSDVS